MPGERCLSESLEVVMIGVRTKIEDFDQSEVFRETLTTLLKIMIVENTRWKNAP